MEDAIKDIVDCRKDSWELYGKFLDQAEDDQKVALGKQWLAADEAKLKGEDRPALNLNLVGKGCRMISAQHRQNPMDIVYYPVDGTDQEGADVYTKVSKWLFTNGQYSMTRNLAFDDTIYTGIGWLSPEMCYDYDPLYGDIILNHDSIYSILPDPYLTKMNLEDCDYIIRQKFLSKQKVISLWLEYKNEIEALTGGKSIANFKKTVYSEDKLYVTERWYREYEDIKVLFDPRTMKSMVWPGTDEELRYQLAMESLPSIQVIKRRVPVMRLQIGINDELLVWDGDVPDGYSTTKYPFIPIWGFFAPHYNETEWGMKLFGYAHALIDSQREKNKARSILMDIMMRSLRGRLMVEEGAVKDIKDLNDSRGKPIILNSGGLEKIKEMDSPMIDSAMVQLEQLHTQDIKEMGLNPDLLQVEGGSAASAPTSSLQLRREQGMMPVQPLFDNLGFANRQLGLYNIDLINMWPASKIEKIIGQPLPKDWEQRKENSRYDCTADEKQSSPTYRQSVFNQVLQLQQHGAIKGDLPPEVTMELIDMSSDVKKIWMKSNQQKQQQAQQIQQMQQQLEQAKIQIQMQKEQLQQQGETNRLLIEEKGKTERLQMELINDLAVAREKSKAAKNKLKKVG